MWAEFIVIGGWVFWALAFIASLFIIGWSASDKPGLSIIPVGLFLAVLVLFSPFNPFAWIVANPINFLLGVLAYLGVGTVWTFIKWYSFSYRAMEVYKKFRTQWMSDRKIETFIKVDHAANLQDYIQRQRVMEEFGGSIPPEPEENLNRIFTWMIYWPWSLFWTFLSDPLVRLFDFVFKVIRGSLSNISRRRFKKFEEFN